MMRAVCFFFGLLWCVAAVPCSSHADKSRFITLKSGAISLDSGRSHMPLRAATAGKGLALPQGNQRGYISLASHLPMMRPALSLPTSMMAASKNFERQHTPPPQSSPKKAPPQPEEDAATRQEPIAASSANVVHRHQWPVDPATAQRVSSPFGYRKDPFTGERAFHAGIDIAAAKGTNVLASAEGVVNSVGTHPRLGRYIRIDHHTGEYSLYGHLSAIHVEAGQKVTTQQVIGAVGSTGRSTGPHLDYSLRRNSKPIDPLKVLPDAPAKQSASLK